MDRQNEFYHSVDTVEKERRRKERKEKWAKLEKGFWKSFLMTEDGKPKSGLLIYTFCLSLVFLGVYIIAFWFAIEELTQPLSALPPVLGNLIQSLTVGAVGAGLSALLHILLPNKRLAFGTHLWLAVYVIASIITLAILLGDWDTIAVMLVFAFWFAVIPLAIGLTVTYLLYRKDYNPPVQPVQKPAWKQYTERR